MDVGGKWEACNESTLSGLSVFTHVIVYAQCMCVLDVSLYMYVYSGVLCCITLSIPALGSKPLMNGGICYIYIACECWLCQINQQD